MTPEAMRIAIAESEGWKRGKRADSSFHDPSKTIYNDCWIDPRGNDCRKLPDFCEDLNAILPLLPWGTVMFLECAGWHVDGPEGEHTAVNQSLALAACEFYLKWKGLWKE